MSNPNPDRYICQFCVVDYFRKGRLLSTEFFFRLRVFSMNTINDPFADHLIGGLATRIPQVEKSLVFRDPGPTNQHTPVDDSLGSPGCMVLELIILGEGVFASTSGLARLQSKYCVPLRLLSVLPPA